MVDAGSGSISLIGGATNPGFNSVSPSDPLTAGDFAFQTESYPAQGAADRTAGVRFNVSTLGFENVSFSFDLRNSNTSSRSVAVQYSLDGSTFTELTTFAATGGDQWNSRSLDLSGIAGANNNVSFAFRVVTAMENGASSDVPTILNPAGDGEASRISTSARQNSARGNGKPSRTGIVVRQSF